MACQPGASSSGSTADAFGFAGFLGLADFFDDFRFAMM